jgi:sugar/nucleoside kinase (ribokinase family)
MWSNSQKKSWLYDSLHGFAHRDENAGKPFCDQTVAGYPGKAGVLALFQGDIFHYPSVPVASVDTTGAGDAFVAGLLWQLAQTGLPHSEPDLALSLKYAQRCARWRPRRKGR